MLDYLWIHRAGELALKGEFRCLHGCVITTEEGSWLGEGWNKLKYHPIQAQYAHRVGRPEKVYLHAEIAALIDALRKGCKVHTAYCARINRSAGKFDIARPCPACYMALAEAGIKKVYYTTATGEVALDEL